VKKITQKFTAAEMLRFFAGPRAEELQACQSTRARAIKVGQFLAPKVGREVPVEVDGRAGKAVLRVEEGRAKERRYYFEFSWDGDEKRQGRPGGEDGDRPGKKPGKKARERKEGAGEAGKGTRAGKGRPDKGAGKHGKKNGKKKPAGGGSGRGSGSRKTETPPKKAAPKAQGNDENWG